MPTWNQVIKHATENKTRLEKNDNISNKMTKRWHEKKEAKEE